MGGVWRTHEEHKKCIAFDQDTLTEEATSKA
jgi:hypothetical protein